MRDCDPDIVTGYNINNFDLPYLLNRAKTLKVRHTEHLVIELELRRNTQLLKVPNFAFLGRMNSVQSVVKETVLQSKQMGRRENKR